MKTFRLYDRQFTEKRIISNEPFPWVKPLGAGLWHNSALSFGQ